jgi:predicted metal-dependent phosphoesterase TrpH
MRADLHFHTTVSDGIASPDVMVSMVKKRGLDGFSITDHDNPGNVKKYEQLAAENDLVYISGMEITSEKGHLLVYCLPERAGVLREFVPLQPIKFYIEKAQDLDVVIAPAHPFDYFRHGMGTSVFEYKWSAVETFNGSTVFPFANRRAQKAASTLKVPEIGGSDAHTQYYVGFVYTEAEASTAGEFLNQVVKGNTSVGGSHLNVVQFSRRILKSKIFK